jgi:hypothetical protein
LILKKTGKKTITITTPKWHVFRCVFQKKNQFLVSMQSSYKNYAAEFDEPTKQNKRMVLTKE